MSEPESPECGGAYLAARRRAQEGQVQGADVCRAGRAASRDGALADDKKELPARRKCPAIDRLRPRPRRRVLAEPGRREGEEDAPPGPTRAGAGVHAPPRAPKRGAVRGRVGDRRRRKRAGGGPRRVLAPTEMPFFPPA